MGPAEHPGQRDLPDRGIDPDGKTGVEPTGKKSGPMLDKTPLGRFGEPVEIADMALYLASPAADLVNGSVIIVDGGFTSV